MLLFVCFILLSWTVCDAQRPMITSFPEQLTVADGDSVTLTCIISGLDVQNMVFWNRGTAVIALNREILQQQDRLTVSGSDSTGTFNLHIESVTEDDAGEYQCQVPGYQPLVNQISTLTVNVRPTFVEFSPDAARIDVEVGDKLQLHCTATGKPTPTIKWTRRQQAQDDREEIMTDWDTLIIANVGRQDGGVYTCIAENAAAILTRQVSVNVQYKPVLELDATSQHVDVGYALDARLACTFRSRPAPTVTWQHDGVTVDSESVERVENETDVYRSTLTINDVDTDDVGLYRCIAKNELGEEFTDVFVSGLPGHVGVDDNVLCEFSDACKLHWTVDSLSPIISYELEYELVFASSSDSNETHWSVTFTSSDSASTDHTLEELEANTMYRGRLKAVNVFGSSAWSLSFTFTTADVGMTAPPLTTTTSASQRLQRDRLHRADNGGAQRSSTMYSGMLSTCVMMSAVIVRLIGLL